jgi:PiT family inorganic phosphate transporter
MPLTHYEILGVGPDATHEAMRRAYQLRVQLLHPDRHMGAAPDVIAEAQRATTELNRGFRRGQLISAAAFSLGHGANDAQKTMGIILAVLIASKHVAPDAGVPLWVVLAAHTAIGLGTLTGGWRIVKTMGSKITRLQPIGGVAAETAAAATLFFTSSAGIPVSTTHTITGAIVGVGATRRLSAVRWGVASQVVWAWVLTIPGAFAISFVTSLLVRAVA